MKKSACLLTILLAVLTAESAWANASYGPTPGPLGLISVVAVMFVATLVGGGYAVFKRRGKKRLALDSALIPGTALFSFFILPFIWIPGGSTGLDPETYAPVMIVLVLAAAVLVILRGLRLVRWGLAARKAINRPEYLVGADPWRLLPAGFGLIVITVVLTATMIALAWA